jgi:TM2 domain-containing membrane protein YozV
MGQTPDTASPPWLPPPPSPPPIPPNFSHFPNPAYTPQPPPLPHQRTISNPKSRVAFVLLGLFLGGFGIHNFYAGYTSKAITQLLLVLLLFWTVLVPLGVAIWVIVEVITVKHDAEGNKLS